MSQFPLALELGGEALVALLVSLLSLGVGGYALRAVLALRARSGVRPFRRFRLVNKSKTRHLTVARVSGVGGTVYDLTRDASNNPAPIPYQPAPPPSQVQVEGSRCLETTNLASSGVMLELQADQSTQSRQIALPAALGLNWPSPPLESVDVVVTAVDESAVNFGYTLLVTVARYVTDFPPTPGGPFSLEVATVVLAIPASP